MGIFFFLTNLFMTFNRIGHTFILKKFSCPVWQLTLLMFFLPLPLLFIIFLILTLFSSFPKMLVLLSVLTHENSLYTHWINHLTHPCSFSYYWYANVSKILIFSSDPSPMLQTTCLNTQMTPLPRCLAGTSNSVCLNWTHHLPLPNLHLLLCSYLSEWYFHPSHEPKPRA